MNSWEVLCCQGLLGQVLWAAELLHSSQVGQDLGLSVCPIETERRQWRSVDIQGLLASTLSTGCLKASLPSAAKSKGPTLPQVRQFIVMVKLMEKRSSRSVQSATELLYPTCSVSFLSLWSTLAPALQPCPILVLQKEWILLQEPEKPHCLHLRPSLWEHLGLGGAYLKPSGPGRAVLVPPASSNNVPLQDLWKGADSCSWRDIGSVAPRMWISDGDKLLCSLQDFYMFSEYIGRPTRQTHPECFLIAVQSYSLPCSLVFITPYS